MCRPLGPEHHLEGLGPQVLHIDDELHSVPLRVCPSRVRDVERRHGAVDDVGSTPPVQVVSEVASQTPMTEDPADRDVRRIAGFPHTGRPIERVPGSGRRSLPFDRMGERRGHQFHIGAEATEHAGQSVESVVRVSHHVRELRDHQHVHLLIPSFYPRIGPQPRQRLPAHRTGRSCGSRCDRLRLRPHRLRWASSCS